MSHSLDIRGVVGRRVLVLDGGMGSVIQGYRLSGCNPGNKPFCYDYLSVTHPDVISSIHQKYVDAGADIISTNTFCANAGSLATFGLQHLERQINLQGATLARSVANMAPRKVWVAGSVGPAAEPSITQMMALIEGGVDILLLETQTDLACTVAAVSCAREAMKRCNRRVELMISVTLTKTGLMLSGHTPEELLAAVRDADPLSVGFNCGFGADDMLRHLPSLQNAPCAVSLHPNAGLPDADGRYCDTPEIFAAKMQKILNTGMVNIVGGCCGTTPDHISVLAEMASHATPRLFSPRVRGREEHGSL